MVSSIFIMGKLQRNTGELTVSKFDMNSDDGVTENLYKGDCKIVFESDCWIRKIIEKES